MSCLVDNKRDSKGICETMLEKLKFKLANYLNHSLVLLSYSKYFHLHCKSWS